MTLDLFTLNIALGIDAWSRPRSSCLILTHLFVRYYSSPGVVLVWAVSLVSSVCYLLSLSRMRHAQLSLTGLTLPSQHSQPLTRPANDVGLSPTCSVPSGLVKTPLLRPPCPALPSRLPAASFHSKNVCQDWADPARPRPGPAQLQAILDLLPLHYNYEVILNLNLRLKLHVPCCKYD